MRTTVIPAQITTVEDKIAGSLNLTQILILMVPVFWSTIIYSLLSPKMGLAWYKLPLILIVLFSCLVLSLRIKGMVVLNWLVVLLRFYLRPKYYLFDKNDAYLRTLDLPVSRKKEIKFFKRKTASNKIKQAKIIFSFSDFIKFENLLGNPKYTISFKSGRRAGLNVAFEKISK